MRSRPSAATVVLVAILAACSTGGAPITPSAPGSAVPDLTGTWTGTWDGAPLTLVVSHHAEAGASGVYAGPWLVFGRREPAVHAVLTSTVRGRTVTSAAQGRIERIGDALALVVEAPTTFGTRRLTLKTEGANRLQGSGESAFGARGHVVLTRAAP